MKKGLYSLAVLAVIFFVYIAFNFDRPIWVAFDEQMYMLLKYNEWIIAFHYLGETKVAIVIGILFILYFAFKKKDYRTMLFVVLVFAGGNGLNQFFKHLVQRQRPEILDQLTSYSFPSGHTTAGVFTFMCVAYFLTLGMMTTKRRIVIWLVTILLVVLIGLSRVAEGRHFATDVLAGWCIGYAWFMVCVWWYERRKEQFKNG